MLSILILSSVHVDEEALPRPDIKPTRRLIAPEQTRAHQQRYRIDVVRYPQHTSIPLVYENWKHLPLASAVLHKLGNSEFVRLRRTPSFGLRGPPAVTHNSSEGTAVGGIKRSSWYVASSAACHGLRGYFQRSCEAWKDVVCHKEDA